MHTGREVHVNRGDEKQKRGTGRAKSTKGDVKNREGIHVKNRAKI